ncbi:MAG: TRAP transporter substrate-binding protein [Clostridiales bacterium]|nr:TRAP transporter substrate-binding protein [Clostridiales bacterium]MCF8022232.1 TRAP transporter substrate-binding protein [Clostridiales bacterium]
MFRNKLSIVVAALFMLTLVVSGCGGGGESQSSDSDEPVVLKAGHALAESHPYHLGAVEFKEIVEEKTDGKVKVEIHSNATLGSERDMIEGLQMGSIDVVVTSTGPVINFIPEMGVFDLPFLFSSTEHAHKVLDSEIGQDLLKKFDDIGIKGLAFWENGFRNLTNSKHPVNSVEDVKGLKIRTMENEVHQEAFKALDANPTPMAWGEVFTSLQQGTIDGQENPIPVIYSQKLYEVQDYLAMTGHVYSPSLCLMSEKAYDKLTPEQQEIVNNAAMEAAEFERNKIKEQTETQLSKLKEKGMKITEPNTQKFRESTKGVYDKYEDKFGKERIEKILEADPGK